MVELLKCFLSCECLACVDVILILLFRYFRVIDCILQSDFRSVKE